jgi:hypothetical protein
VNGAGELDPAERHFGRATVIHRLNVLNAFPLEPGADFVGGNHSRASSFRDVDHVSDMISVAM